MKTICESSFFWSPVTTASAGLFHPFISNRSLLLLLLRSPAAPRGKLDTPSSSIHHRPSPARPRHVRTKYPWTG